MFASSHNIYLRQQRSREREIKLILKISFYTLFCESIHHKKKKKKHLALRHEFYFAVALKYHTLSCFGKSVWIVYSMSVLWLHKPWVACCAVLASIPPSLCKFLVQVLKYWCEFRSFCLGRKGRGRIRHFLFSFMLQSIVSPNAGMEATSSFGWLEEERLRKGASIIRSEQQQVGKQETNALFFPFPFWIFLWI